MTSAARIAANRRNAQRSTGPRTPAGKARVARNARRHGLACPASCDPGWSEEIKALAHTIAGADGERYEPACAVAAAQIDLMRARRARCDLFSAALHERDGIRRLATIGRYERRALARRKFAIRNFDAHEDSTFGRTNPTQTDPGMEHFGRTNPTQSDLSR